MKLTQITEVSLITDIGKTHKSWADTKAFTGKVFKEELFGKSILKSGKLASGNWAFIDTDHMDFYKARDRYSYWGSQYVLLAYDTAGKIQVAASLNKHGKSYSVDHLVSKNGSTIPAYKMYAAFVRAGFIMTSSEQSEGGMRVWMKLSGESGVVVHGWNKATRKPVNLGAKFDDSSDTHSSYDDFGWYSRRTVDKSFDPNDKVQLKHEKDIRHNVILVAAKK